MKQPGEAWDRTLRSSVGDGRLGPGLRTGMKTLLRDFDFLSEAGARLAGSFDYEGTLSELASRAVPCFGDWCLVALFEDDGWIRRLRAPHAQREDSAIEGRSWRAAPAFHPAIGAAILDSPDEKWFHCFTCDEYEAARMLRLGLKSLLVAPMAAPGKTVGAITLLSTSPERKWNAAELGLWTSLGCVAAAAVVNAQRFREMAAAREQAEQSNRAKDEFLAVLSHELRNPLTPVMGWARIFKNHPEVAADPVLREGSQSLERNAAQIARLVDDCLDLARISQGKIHMDREQLDLNKVLAGSAEAVRETAIEKGLSVSCELSASPLWVFGDRIRLQQVFTNLLVNAAKYTDHGGTITVRSRLDAREAEVEVRDTGCGIDPADLEKIFEPFRQAERSLSASSGLGLGLAISRQIVELHSGRIWAESRGPSQGSSFFLRIPLSEPTVPPTTGPFRPPPPGFASEEPPRKLRILVVEDARDVLMLMKIQLESLGHTVLLAADGLQGVQQACKDRPDLILSDLKMPRADGYELIRQIRQIPETAGIPAIALTGMGMRGDAARAKEAGFDACVVKPVETRELLKWIQTLTAS